MRLGMIGLPGAGKSTVFQVLTQIDPGQGGKKEPFIATVRVPDQRVDALSRLFKPKKTVYGDLEYLLQPGAKAYALHSQADEAFWGQVRPCDGLIHVVRNFRLAGDEPPQANQDIGRLDSEMIFADLVVIEKRMERINLDRKRGKQVHEEEQTLLEKCLKVVESEKPLRDYPELTCSPLLRGFAFLSAKPVLIIYNNSDEDETFPPGQDVRPRQHALVVRGKLEKDLTEVSSEEAREFSEAYSIHRPAMERVAQHSCELLGLISFFTVVHDEVRCWMVPRGTTALDGAGVIHSDIQRGFIRAEVLGFDDLMASGSYSLAKKGAKVRLEGKDYTIEDGDVIYFRFHV